MNLPELQQKMFVIRGHKVMLDFDLTEWRKTRIAVCVNDTN